MQAGKKRGRFFQQRNPEWLCDPAKHLRFWGEKSGTTVSLSQQEKKSFAEKPEAIKRLGPPGQKKAGFSFWALLGAFHDIV